jgi:2-iminobutanoate/2-iminopropanoate deaminase
MREINSELIPSPRGHFSHAVSAGSMVFGSGLLALDDAGLIAAPDDPGAQTRQIFRSLAAVLEAPSASAQDVVKVTIYVTDLADRVAVSAARADFFGPHRPASTMVAVVGLAAEGARVEIDAVALVADTEQTN